MLNGYRFRLYPNLEQEQILLRWIGCQRLIYNAKVQEDRYYRRFQQRMVGTAGMEVPVDQQYSRFITPRTAFLREVPSQILRNGAVKFRRAYQRFVQKLGGRPKLKKKSGRQAVWVTSELFQFIPLTEEATGHVTGYRLHVGTDTFLVGMISYVAHRHHAVPKPLVTSDGQIHDLDPVQKDRIQQHRKQHTTGQRKASRRKKGSKNQNKAYRKAARYQQYEKNVRQDYAHQTSHRLVANDSYDVYVFEDLAIQNMTKRPQAKKDAEGRFLPNGRNAKAGLNRAILSSAWGAVVSFTSYKALRSGKLVIKVPFAYSSQECAVCTFTSPDNRPSQAAFVCQRCVHGDNVDHNAACVIAKRGINKLLSENPVTKAHKATRIFPRKEHEDVRKLGPERSEVTPGEITQDVGGPRPPTQRSMSQEFLGTNPETPASAS